MALSGDVPAAAGLGRVGTPSLSCLRLPLWRCACPHRRLTPGGRRSLRALTSSASTSAAVVPPPRTPCVPPHTPSTAFPPPLSVRRRRPFPCHHCRRPLPVVDASPQALWIFFVPPHSPSTALLPPSSVWRLRPFPRLPSWRPPPAGLASPQAPPTLRSPRGPSPQPSSPRWRPCCLLREAYTKCGAPSPRGADGCGFVASPSSNTPAGPCMSATFGNM